jgi:hypothetical protein
MEAELDLRKENLRLRATISERSIFNEIMISSALACKLIALRTTLPLRQNKRVLKGSFHR